MIFMRKTFFYLILGFLLLFPACKGGDDAMEDITGGVVIVPDAEQDTEPEPEVIPEIKEEIKTINICYDSDNGIVRWEKGKIMGYYDNGENYEFDDYCIDKNYVVEFYCEEEKPYNISFLCRNGCQDSHCN